MTKRNRKGLLNALFLISIFLLTVWAVFKGEDLHQIGQALTMANPWWILPGIACVVLFIIGESAVILYLLRTLGTRIPFGHCCLYSFIGFFYSCITPSASGGQPMQVIAMRKDKIPVAVSTVVLAIVTITYKLVLVAIGLSVMLLRPAKIMQHLAGVEGLVYLGLGLNIIAISLLLMLVFCPSILRKCATVILGWIGRIRPFRHPERINAKLDEIMAQYTGTADYYRSHKLVIFNVFMITLLQRIILFLVTWLTYKAFGLSGDSLLTIVTLQAIISVVVDMLPLPGGMGISENLFLQIFLPVFGGALVLPGMLISRGVSYYTQLLISAAMTVAASFLLRNTNDKETSK